MQSNIFSKVAFNPVLGGLYYLCGQSNSFGKIDGLNCQSSSSVLRCYEEWAGYVASVVVNPV